MRFVAVVFCTMTILAGERVSADSFNFAPYVPSQPPDIAADGDTAYVAGISRVFTMTANPEYITYPSLNTEYITGGAFRLIAQIPLGAVGHLPPDGFELAPGTSTLSIRGNTGTLNGLLLTGDLFAARAFPGSGVMDFLFHVTGGLAASYYGGNDSVGYITVGYTGFRGDFDISFTSDPDIPNSATADTTSIVPEPASFLLAVFGVVGMVAGVRLRRKRSLQA